MTKQKQVKFFATTNICVDPKENLDIFTTSEFLYNNNNIRGLDLNEKCALTFDDELQIT